MQNYITSEGIYTLVENLCEKYKPQHMSQDEYNRFIDDLANGGTLNRAETEDMSSRYGITVDPVPGGIVQVRPGKRLAWSFSDANGNAKVFLHTLQRWYDSGTQADEARSNAIRKANSVYVGLISGKGPARSYEKCLPGYLVK